MRVSDDRLLMNGTRADNINDKIMMVNLKC